MNSKKVKKWPKLTQKLKSTPVIFGRFWPFYEIFECCLKMPKTVNSDAENLIFLSKQSEKFVLRKFWALKKFPGKPGAFQGRKMAQNGLL